jgi:ferredoxin
VKATVDEKTCIGCGVCTDNCPQVFEMRDGVAKVIADPVPADAEDACREAEKGCPVEAIKTT